MKPAFVVVTAWAFSEGANRRDMPGVTLALLLLPATIVPLILQPDFGQTMLITMVWCTLFFVAGLHWFWVAGLGFAGMIGVFTAYTFLHHVRERINRFMDPESGDSFQEVWSRESFNSGGWFGTGPGEGVAKRHLPTRIPTSSSRSPARNSACWCAWASSHSSPTSSSAG